MGPTVFETQRLNLRTWTLEDAPAMVGIFESPEVAEFINDGKPATLDQVTKFIERYIRIQTDRGWCRWAIELKDRPQRLAGFCGVGCTFAPEIELGWTLRRDLWGKGFATEAAQGALDYCFNAVGFPRVISAIDPKNHRSEAVAKRLGMAQDGTIDHEGTSLMRYAILNPFGEASEDPRYIRNCDGEPRGSVLHDDQPAL